MAHNEQIVVLYTDDGSAHDERVLRNIWEYRLNQCGARHYKIITAKIVKERD